MKVRFFLSQSLLFFFIIELIVLLSCLKSVVLGIPRFEYDQIELEEGVFIKLREAFTILNKKVALVNLKWEKLQYNCYKLRVPLSNEEFQILQAIYSHIRNSGIIALNLHHLKTTINHQVKIPNLSRILPSFFVRLDANWNLQFYPPAFGIER